MTTNTNKPQSMEAILGDIVYPALEEILSMKETAIEISETTVLFGEGAVLNSLELVSFIVLVEERVNDNLESGGITLTSEKAMSRSSTPFRTVRTLAEYIDELLEEEAV
ncbi:hypothetical protein J4772_15865 [Cohnella sp. LGH]|uniref:Carrier domain-containing protein n=1 Tax=Cohnella phaseoli TaxID=456490 RepID=A0A3D9KJ81_9BACL|nr:MULTISPECIES: hypothetical protein [Cohnella]QTH45764.1 hypothetical protein J4772_15865 [Cohnella sp. LGH]RED86538.1 hypothetical protein DFP98_103393 [Cohnella phaseoli]